MLSIRATLKRDDHETILNMPCNDYDIDTAMQNIGEADMTNTTQFVSQMDSNIRELSVLQDRFINVDELNFLAKRLDSFSKKELNQFRAAMVVVKPVELKDMINLTYNLHNYTLISDFSNMDAVGKTHFLNVEGAIATNQEPSIDYRAIGEDLLSTGGTTTQYGVLFQNGIHMEEIYDGQVFPNFLYECCVFAPTIGYAGKTETLYMPCTRTSIEKAVHRLGAPGMNECSLENLDALPIAPDWLAEICPNYDNADVYGLNKLSAVITDFEPEDYSKLVAICSYAEIEDFEKAALLAENIDSFEFVPYVDDYELLGRYLIRATDSYLYDENLDDYYDFEKLGEDTADNQRGEFTVYGYVGIKDNIEISEIIGQSDEMTNSIRMEGM